MGDGIMALFGAPVAHEDAVRACYAALRMQELVSRYGDLPAELHGRPPGLRPPGRRHAPAHVRASLPVTRAVGNTGGGVFHLRMPRCEGRGGRRPGAVISTAALDGAAPGCRRRYAAMNLSIATAVASGISSGGKWLRASSRRTENHICSRANAS